jgi:hypothetical protein
MPDEAARDYLERLQPAVTTSATSSSATHALDGSTLYVHAA